VEQITPIGIGVYTTPDCQLFYGVERDDENPYSISRTSFVVEADAEMVYAGTNTVKIVFLFFLFFCYHISLTMPHPNSIMHLFLFFSLPSFSSQVGHLHTGGVNISMYLNSKHICTSFPRYGMDPSNKAGDEKGYL